MQRRAFIRLTITMLGAGAAATVLPGCAGGSSIGADTPDLARGTSSGPGPDAAAPGATDLATGVPVDQASPAADLASSPPPDLASAPACAAGASGIAFTGHQGHSLMVPAAHFVGPVERSYSIMGLSAHDHTVTLSATHFATLAAGQNVVVTSTSGAGHTHMVTVACA